MSNENNISLSQEEVDRLLGQHRESKIEIKPKKVYERVQIASDEEISKFEEIMQTFTNKMRMHLKKIFLEQGIRKLTPAKTEQMSQIEFMSQVTNTDFFFLVEINEFELLLKLDSFLFCALSGISFNVNHKTNLFQNEVLRNSVAPILVNDLLKSANKTAKIKITSLYNMPYLDGLNTATPGICASFTWNEGFKSLGTEKFFFQKDFLDFLLA
ncbi:MAG: hypothetical protein IKO57_14295 [Treponema sp.]|nr:hypothetical protein [Treponema sp.]MBR4631588.1 hypothetical protein [Treponema sp.]MBR6912882.1 hypothetical protein [Treponema sp.]